MRPRSLYFPMVTILLTSSQLLLAGCQSTPGDASLAPRQDPLASAPPITRGLDGESLARLLNAEIAGQRGNFDMAARDYVAESERRQSLALAERATLAARYAHDPALLEKAATRWAELASHADTPHAGAPHRILAEIAGQRSDWREAIRQLLAVDALGETIDLEAFVEDAVDQGADLTMLLHELDDYITQHPKRPAPRIAAALLDTRAKNFDNATARLDGVELRWPDSPSLWLARSQLGLERGQPNMALKAARHGQTLAPDDSRFVLAQAQAYLELHRIDAAKTQFDTLLRRHPDNTALRMSLAKLYLQYDRPTAASELLLPLAKGDDTAPEVYSLLALSAEQNNDIDTALLYYRQVPEGDQFLSSRARAAQLLTEHDRLLEARQFLDAERETHPGYDDDLFALELALLDQAGQRNTADMLLDREVSKRAPDNSDLLFTRAIRAMEAGDLPAMERDMQTLLARDPDNAEVLNAYGYTLTDRTDRHQQALELLERAHRLDPQSPAILDSLGWAHFHLGQFDQALELLQRAYSGMPDEEVAAHLAETLWAMKRSAEARALVHDALGQFDTHPTLDTLLSRHPALAPADTQQPETATSVLQETTP